MPSRAKSITPTRALWLLPFAAALAILPLILHGNSCGHDQVFHIQGWLDAAQQLRHGHYPRWSFTSAWNAGEPRFLFYPPLSWLLGALLTLILPAALAPTVFVFIALLLAGLTFHHLASCVLETSAFANAACISPNAALIASALYLANPYMLFNAFERTAYAELLAAAWIPLLLLAILRPRPTVRSVAIPIALLWLTNAPAAVMGCYALALLATLRLILSLRASYLSSRRDPASAPSSQPELTENSSSRPERIQNSSSRPEPRGFLRGGVERPLYFAHAADNPASPQDPLRLALTYIVGTLLGLALPAWYLLPAAYERRFVQVTMAIIPGMRPQDNFLFAHAADSGHNGVNLQISLLALTLIALTFAALIALLLRTYLSNPRVQLPPSAQDLPPSAQDLPPSAQDSAQDSVILSEVSRDLTRETQPKDPPPTQSPQQTPALLPLTLTFLAAVITFLLFPPSTFLWLHVPDLAFLQLPWRLLTLLTPVLALTIALLLSPRTLLLPPSAQDSAKDPGAPSMTRPHRGMGGVTTIFTLTAALATLLLPLALGFAAFHLYAQYCHADDLPAAIAQNLATHHGFPPTDEYTPTHADNDILRTDNPAYWLLPNLPNGQPANPNTPAPNTTPTATELDPLIDSDDTPVPLAQTLSTKAPHHLTLNLQQPATVVLNLRDYPNWRITETTGTNQLSPSAQDRDDGLLAIPVPAGPSTLDITWHRTPDQTLGLVLSALALLALALTYRRPT